jgi:hypothetical protein
MPIRCCPCPRTVVTHVSPTNKSLIEGIRCVDLSAIAAGGPGGGAANRGSFQCSTDIHNVSAQMPET